MSQRESSPGSVPSPDSERRAIVEQAAEWFGRREGGLSQDEEEEFTRWLNAAVRHRQVFQEFDQTWDFFGGLDNSPKVKSPAPIPWPILPRGPSGSRSRRTTVIFLSAMLAAAAAIAMLLVPQTQKRDDHASFANHTSTAGSGIRKLQLPDGSEVSLNANSGIEVRFTKNERLVKLVRGEAHFAVAKNATWPFIVSAGGVSVKAVGTAFNVRLGTESVDVLVTEGKVVVGSVPVRSGRDAALPTAVFELGAPLLEAGKRAIVSRADSREREVIAITQVTVDEMTLATEWHVRQLEFDMTPLSEAVAQFNRYNRHQLVIADAELARRPFGGSFRAENYAAFVDVLESNFGVAAERTPERTVLRRR